MSGTFEWAPGDRMVIGIQDFLCCMVCIRICITSQASDFRIIYILQL